MADSQRKRKDRASRAYADGRLKDALELYRAIVRDDPNDLNARMKIGDIHRKRGDMSSAVDAYEWVAEAYAQDGLLLKAIAICKVILSLDPRHTATQTMLAELYGKRRGPASSVGNAPVAPSHFGMPMASAAPAPVPDAPLDGPKTDPTGLPATLSASASMPPEAEEDFEIEMEAPLEAPPPPPRVPPPAPGPAASQESPGARFKRGFIPEAQTWAGEIRIEDLERIKIGTIGRAASEPAPNDHEAGPATGPISSPEARPVPSSLPRGTRPAGLPEIPLFSDLPKAAFIELLLHIKHRDVQPGEIVIREGDPGDSFFVVAEGQVRVSRYNDQGQQVRLARLKDGAFFGEMALLQSGPRTATVVAETEGQILEISREAVEKVIAQYPTVATALRNFHRQRLLATAMATNELFRPFPPDDRRRLMEKFKAKHFERGEVLVQEESPATGLYILLHGRLVVTKQHGDDELQLAELNPGEMFGEMSLLSNEPTSATVTAITDCFVIRLSKRKFQEVMMTHPHVLELVSKIGEERRADNESLLGMRHSHHAAILV